MIKAFGVAISCQIASQETSGKLFLGIVNTKKIASSNDSFHYWKEAVSYPMKEKR